MTTQTLEVLTHCPYCALQCGMEIRNSGSGPYVMGNAEFPVNNGALCIKGWTSLSAITHHDRLLTPLVRNEMGELVKATWEEALERTARAFKDVQAENGRDAAGVFGGGSLTNEKAYLLGKFARVVLKTASIDYNGRFCMSSAAAASIQAFGIDRGLPFPLKDIPMAEVILLVGGNVAETMPPIMQYFQAQRNNGGQLFVVDPRRTTTAQSASLHMKLVPGSDAALANGLLHILIKEGLIDESYISQRTNGFDSVNNLVASYWPERVERITGVPESQLLSVARALGKAKTAMVLTARGPEQQSHGVNNVLTYINLALALGLVGKPFSGYGTITGQGNGQGGREMGQKADQLPGYRRIDNPQDRKHMAEVWNVEESDIPGRGKSAYEMIDSIGTDDGVKALLVIGSNIQVSAPNAPNVKEKLKTLKFLAVADFFPSETAQMADVVFPSAQWAEEEGTMTNLEGRVILRKKALDPPGEVKTDLEILFELAHKLGKGQSFCHSTSSEIFDEIRRATAGSIADYSGISYSRIEDERGIQWPCPDAQHSGTPRLFADSFPLPDGKAQFHAVSYQAPGEEPDDSFPLYLTTGRVLHQYQSGTQTRRIDELSAMGNQPLAEIHPVTAKRYALKDGDPVALVSRRGRAVARVKVTLAIRDDTIFVPFHWGGDQSINRVTNAALDPVSKMPEFKVCAVRIEKA